MILFRLAAAGILTARVVAVEFRREIEKKKTSIAILVSWFILIRGP